jgi:hypothetical protein
MHVVIHKREAARRRSYPVARLDTAEVASGRCAAVPQSCVRGARLAAGGQAAQLAVGRPLPGLARRVALSHDRHLVI